MKSRSFHLGLVVCIVLELCAARSEPFRLAAPGYRYVFPRDHFSHPEFQTEWWYYTGNLHTSQGRRFGFELTFFRHGVDRKATKAAVWDVRDLWLAHLALSDLDGGRFLHTERLNRAGPGIAGADREQARVWNGNWQAKWNLDPHATGGMASQQLQAIADRFSFALTVKTAKAPVIHGENGISQKAEGPGRASHYISFTRLLTAGVLVIEGRRFDVEGESWMDHEFFTHQLAANQSGWDWFSLQLQDGSEIMLFQLRRKDGTLDPFSAGTFVDSRGRATHLSAKDFSLAPGKLWTSPNSGGRYPIEWRIRVPSLDLDAGLTTRLAQQELTGKTRSGPTYWEGAVEVMANRKGHPLKGLGYLEMTGYAGPAPMAMFSSGSGFPLTPSGAGLPRTRCAAAVATFHPVVQVKVIGGAQRRVVKAHQAERFPQVLFEAVQSLKFLCQRRRLPPAVRAPEFLEPAVYQPGDLAADEPARTVDPEFLSRLVRNHRCAAVFAHPNPAIHLALGLEPRTP